MIAPILRKVFGTRNQRLLARMQKIVAVINSLEPKFQALSDDALRGKTDEFRQRIKSGATLDELMPEAFAVVREAGRRTLKLRHFDVQLIGGIVLHSGKIAEMRTGEGKTLMSTLAVYLNALKGEGVHIVTVNDYLAKRDAAWMDPIYQFLGLTVGVNLPFMPQDAKRAAYAADITYGTNNEFGFDYLRDNMAFSLEERVQRKLNYAIVDEVDSILIDEARTPLIISGPAEEGSDMYIKINALIPKLIRQREDKGPGDYSVDEKARQLYLSEEGHQRAEELLIEAGLLTAGESLYSVNNITLLHHLYAGLRGHALYHRDVEYIVKDDEIIIVDEHTGRLMAGRRWSDGIHQAVEAKEGVSIRAENQTLATITLQNYFRLYEKLSGMTGTADTEAYEFQHIYGLEVVVIPTNKPMVRADKPDQVYLTTKAKFAAILEDIKQRSKLGQPVLVGTASIETNELLSKLLQKEKIPHQILNAKQHDKEAKIIAQAGSFGSVTVATNMAGRGTDIVLGGNLEAEISDMENPTPEQITKAKNDWQQRHEKVIAAGGLHVLGTERNESRRIDNQLRGRSGRQGDPGSSQYYLSLEDSLMRIFASDRVANLMRMFGMKEGEVLEHPFVNRAIESAQRKVENHNFDIRKQLLEYDDVANDQRKVIYQQRYELMSAEEIAATIQLILQDVTTAVIDKYIPPQSLEEQWDVSGLEKELQENFALKLDIRSWLTQEENLHEENLRERILKNFQENYQKREAQIGPVVMRQLEKSIMLQTLDTHWKEHLASMEYLRQGIHLRGYAQRNPTQEFKREAFMLFSDMLESLKYAAVSMLCTVEVQAQEDVQVIEQQRRRSVPEQKLEFQHAQLATMAAADWQNEGAETPAQMPMPETYVREAPKIGRNDPCYCGSGKKFKQCHGRIT
jgi:preprotein translocase subunit SecA